MKNFRAQHRPKKSSLVAGLAAITAAVQNGITLDRVYVDTRLRSSDLSAIKKIASEHTIPLNYVPRQKLDSFNIKDHGGCIAQIAKVHYQDLQEVISFVVEQGQTPLFLILDGITDIRNIGGIARTAWCCGVHAIIIPDKGIGALHEDAILTSAGALEKIPVCRVNSLMKAVDALHLNGITVFASEMTASKNIADCDFSVPAAIVMGGEEKGIYPALLKICDERISIPMHNNFESLNVSVATGMILYEVMKQRWG
ncbi:MAG: 23S rRNA (guanosine(2251)-2'-O)-methyltransferase RlmB [Niabella sp.]